MSAPKMYQACSDLWHA